MLKLSSIALTFLLLVLIPMLSYGSDDAGLKGGDARFSNNFSDVSDVSLQGDTGSNLADDAGVYIGLKGGNTRFSNSFSDLSGVSAQDDTGFSLFGGYSFSKRLAIEAEYYRFDTKPDGVSVCSFGGLSSCKNADDDITVNAYAAYGVFQTAGKAYFKARFGYVYEDVESDYRFGDSKYNTDHGIAFSLGSGVRAGPFSFEIEQTLLNGDITFISMGLKWKP
jgi:hypothetical protein